MPILPRKFPDVSIIVPTFNSARFLPETIASVQAQDLTNWEMLLVDDGSDDASVAIAEAAAAQDPRIRSIALGVNSGPSRARNVGILQSRGAHICFLDSDDLLMDGGLSGRLSLLTQFPMLAGVYCVMAYIDEAGTPLGLEAGNRPHVGFCDLGDNKFPCSAMMLRRSAALEHLFDETLQYAEDHDLFGRIARCGGVYAKADRGKVGFRQHLTSLSHKDVSHDLSYRWDVAGRLWARDERCPRAVPSFRDGLTQGMQARSRAQRGFPVAVVEAIRGREDQARAVLEQIDIGGVLLTLDPFELMASTRFIICREFAISHAQFEASMRQTIVAPVLNLLQPYMTHAGRWFWSSLLQRLLGPDARPAIEAMFARQRPHISIIRVEGADSPAGFAAVREASVARQSYEACDVIDCADDVEALNAAIRSARGELVTILYGDEVLHRADALQRAVESLNVRPEAEILYSSRQIVDLASSAVRREAVPADAASLAIHMAWMDRAPPMVWRRSVLDSLGPFVGATIDEAEHAMVQKAGIRGFAFGRHDSTLVTALEPSGAAPDADRMARLVEQTRLHYGIVHPAWIRRMHAAAAVGSSHVSPAALREQVLAANTDLAQDTRLCDAAVLRAYVA